MHQRFEFYGFRREQDCISVIIRCPNGDPGDIKEIQPGHQLFDLARRILDGRLTEEGWIDTNGSPVDCDLDIRTMLGTKTENGSEIHYFMLGAIHGPKGSMEDSTKFESLRAATEMEGEPEFTDVTPDQSDDTKGRYTIEDLLGGPSDP